MTLSYVVFSDISLILQQKKWTLNNFITKMLLRIWKNRMHGILCITGYMWLSALVTFRTTSKVLYKEHLLKKCTPRGKTHYYIITLFPSSFVAQALHTGKRRQAKHKKGTENWKHMILCLAAFVFPQSQKSYSSFPPPSLFFTARDFFYRKTSKWNQLDNAISVPPVCRFPSNESYIGVMLQPTHFIPHSALGIVAFSDINLQTNKKFETIHV